MDKRKGNFIMTYSGLKFYILDPRPEDVSLEDIAHALSQNCRYTGHTEFFYSVGQHSLLVGEEMIIDNCSVKEVLYGFLHDASETYLNDIARPLKPYLKEYSKMEDKVQKVVWEHFKLPEPTEKEWEIVKFYDNKLLYNEIPILMKNPEEFGVPLEYSIEIPSRGMLDVEDELTAIVKYMIDAEDKEIKVHDYLREKGVDVDGIIKKRVR
jgi:hypothetical protein